MSKASKTKWVAFAVKTVAKAAILGGGMEGLPTAMITMDVTNKITKEGDKAKKKWKIQQQLQQDAEEVQSVTCPDCGWPCLSYECYTECR